MRIMAVMGKCISILKKWKQRVLFKRKLREMDNLWLFMGGSCWGLFPPSFYYTHTEEEIEQITNETLERIKKLIDEFKAIRS